MSIPLYLDIRLRDLNRALIRTPNDEHSQRLTDMSNFFKDTANKSGKRFRCFTKDTRNCLAQVR